MLSAVGYLNTLRRIAACSMSRFVATLCYVVTFQKEASFV